VVRRVMGVAGDGGGGGSLPAKKILTQDGSSKYNRLI